MRFKTFLFNFDDLNRKLILKVKGDLDSRDMGREFIIHHLEKFIEKNYNSHRYIIQPLL